MSEPRMLASFVRGALEAIDDLDVELGRQVRASLKQETLDAIEGASAVAWIDVGLDIELTEAFFAVAGRERACRAMRDNLAGTLRKPTLKPLLDGAFAIFDRSPTRILRWTGKAWSLLYKDCGTLECVSAEEHSAEVALRGAPPEITASPNYLDGMGSAILGFFDVAGFDARFEAAHGPEGTRFLLSW